MKDFFWCSHAGLTKLRRIDPTFGENLLSTMVRRGSRGNFFFSARKPAGFFDLKWIKSKTFLLMTYLLSFWYLKSANLKSLFYSRTYGTFFSVTNPAVLLNQIENLVSIHVYIVILLPQILPVFTCSIVSFCSRTCGTFFSVTNPVVFFESDRLKYKVLLLSRYILFF